MHGVCGTAEVPGRGYWDLISTRCIVFIKFINIGQSATCSFAAYIRETLLCLDPGLLTYERCQVYIMPA